MVGIADDDVVEDFALEKLAGSDGMTPIFGTTDRRFKFVKM